jgi:enoyl-CoA hydratase/carnithine racemase
VEERALSSQTVIVEKRDGAVLLTLNRPEAGNACNAELAAELIDIWDRLDRDDAVHAVVLTGAGTRHFCTGADLKRASQASDAGFDRWPDVPEKFFKPVICAINGIVAGGGWHFVWQSDFAIASHGASFLEPHVSVGWVPLREMLGLAGRAAQGPIRRMAYMGSTERMNAERAYQLGIVTELVDAGALVARAMEIATTIARQAPLAVRLQKEAFQRAFDMRFAMRELYDHMHEKRVKVDWESEDGREGPRAFAEKRAPVWKGR